jgi:DNA-binding transcriptional regulator YdaS (Cro superfamily)
MAEAGFTVLLTSDVRLSPQRAPALARLSIGVVTLRLGQSNVATLRPHLARIAEAVRRVRPGQVLTVERADA